MAIWAGAETSQNGEIRIWNALSVIGTKVMAKEYCDENGNNCSEASWGGGISWYQIVTQSYTATSHFNIRVSCPSGKKVLSWWCSQIWSDWDVPWNRSIVENYPDTNSSWTCRVRDINYPQTVKATVYAICATFN
jgi:hypothetical protein